MAPPCLCLPGGAAGAGSPRASAALHGRSGVTGGSLHAGDGSCLRVEGLQVGCFLWSDFHVISFALL